MTDLSALRVLADAAADAEFEARLLTPVWTTAESLDFHAALTPPVFLGLLRLLELAEETVQHMRDGRYLREV